MSVLVTGGAGYIGSHTCVELLNNGYEIATFDNLSNSKEEAIKRIKKITGKDFKFYKTDMLDKEGLRKIFSENKIDAVIHFAGLKAVGESVQVPLKYYNNNITGTVNLCEVMAEFNVKKFVFSSSATVYGETNEAPFTEEMPLSATNPYGRTKLMIEDILRDLYVSDKDWSISLLRYFNPVGAHISGMIGEDPNGIPNNLMPYITQVASGRLEYLKVFGSDYPTVDGTGVRDYIHVTDLAMGHIAALKLIENKTGAFTHNLGRGMGYSVLQVVKAFEEASGVKINYKFMDRRPGDIATSYAAVSKAKKELNWEAKKDISDMCRDSWRWQSQNPQGYAE